MKNNWKQYSIFISSTFIDMDAERDTIKFNVMNMLNTRYRSRKINFQVIDLRSGINTELISEQNREKRILDVCFNCIDSARPFFIGLLGERYGWIPSKSRRESILRQLPEDKKRLLENCGDVSVTEMEILYGAIGNNGEFIDNSLFLYRTPDSYFGMKDDRLEKFCDIPSTCNLWELEMKKNELHDKIRHILVEHSHESQWVPYTLSYNIETDRFDGLDEFAELVYSHLVKLIDNDNHTDDNYNDNLPWWKQEYELSECIAERSAMNTIDRSGKIALDSTCKFISGERNTGKTTLLSQIYRKTGKKKHIAFVGVSPYSQSIRHILLRWLCEMGVTFYDDIPDKKTLSDMELYKKFKESVSKSNDAFFIDNVESLQGDEQLLAWLDRDMDICLGGTEDAFRRLTEIHNFVRLYPIPALEYWEKKKLIDTYEARFYFELSEEIKDNLMSRDISAGDISLTMKLITGLSTDDYREIRKDGGAIEAINTYVKALYNESLSATSGQFYYTVKRFAENVCGSSDILEVIDYIALSRIGLRECDLEQLLAEKWDPVSFGMITNYFSEYFVFDAYTKKWNFKSASLSKEFWEHVDIQSMYKNMATCMMNYDDCDGLKRDIALYYIIRAHCPEGGKEYLSSRKHFHSYDDVSDWYKMAVAFLKNDASVLDDIKGCCMKMNDGEKVTFLSHFLDHGMHFALDSCLYLRIVENCARNISVSSLDRNEAFAFGWLCVNSNLYLKYEKQTDINMRVELLNNGFASFNRVLELDPADEKARSMLTVISTELMDVYIANGDFDKVVELYEK